MDAADDQENNVIFERKRFIRGLFLLGLSSSLGFSSLLPLVNSTTSFLPDQNLGSIGLTLSYAIQLVIAVFFLSFVNKKFGVKKILVFSFGIGCLYPLAFFYPEWYVFFPSCVALGVATVLLLCNVYVYGTRLVYRYEKGVNNAKLSVLMVLMSGVVNASVSGGFLWGNVLEYVILGTDHLNQTNTSDISSVCGAVYCNEDLSSLSTTKSPPKDKYYTLLGIYVGLSLLAFATSLFLEEMSDSSIDLAFSTFKQFSREIRETFLIIIDTKGFLLIIITIFIGVEEAFLVTTFTYAYVNCSLGIAYVGYVMFAYGIGQILFSLIQWLLVKCFGRLFVVGGSIIIFVTCYFSLLYMVTGSDTGAIYSLFIISIGFGIADSTAISNVYSVYGIIFEENIDGSFAVANFWWSLGALLFNSTSPSLCVYIKLYALIASAIVGFAFYAYLEILIRKGRFSNSIR